MTGLRERAEAAAANLLWRAEFHRKHGVTPYATGDAAMDVTIASLLSELAAAVPEWRPIETCPSDGRLVWVVGTGEYSIPEQRTTNGIWWRYEKSRNDVSSKVLFWQPVFHPAPPTDGASK